MNGRIYDPLTGRFLQADPVVQAPGKGQNYNRYAYVLNNPLSLTDPSGFSWLSSFIHRTTAQLQSLHGDFAGGWLTRNYADRAAANPYVRMVGAAVAAYYTFGVASGYFTSAAFDAGASTAFATVTDISAGPMFASLTPAGSAAAGAAAGFAAGGIQGGNIQGALYGAFTGAISGGVNAATADWTFGGRIAARGVAGGVSAAIQGGRFEEGFLISALTSPAKLGYGNMAGREANPLPGGNRPERPYYDPDDSGRQLPEDQTVNVVGLNRNFDGSWKEPLTQSGPFSKFLNYIPGINATAVLHDYWFNMPNHPEFTLFNNIGTILPAAAITYLGLSNVPLSVQLTLRGRR